MSAFMIEGPKGLALINAAVHEIAGEFLTLDHNTTRWGSLGIVKDHDVAAIRIRNGEEFEAVCNFSLKKRQVVRFSITYDDDGDVISDIRLADAEAFTKWCMAGGYIDRKKLMRALDADDRKLGGDAGVMARMVL
jgi:hypothetical protein